MTYPATVINVMIASPGDVASERQLIKSVIDEWNYVHSQHRSLVLMPMGWETHSSPEMGERPQGIINKQVLKDCDLLIAVFWTRIGSPTGKAVSGTVEEIEEHLKLGKPAMLYFSSAPVRPDSVDSEQYAALKKFKEDFRKRGLVEEYESLTEFREKISRHLAQTINRKFQGTDNIGKAATSGPSFAKLGPGVGPVLSETARELLREANKDKHGSILNLAVLGGHIVQANGRNLVASPENREVARWKSAVDELQGLGLIKDRGHKGESYAITDKGYEVIDRLSLS